MDKETEILKTTPYHSKSQLNLVLTMTGVVLVALLVTLYFQNQQLKQELNMLKSVPSNQITITPSPVTAMNQALSPIPSVSSINFTVPANWKTYTDPYGFTAKYPDYWSISSFIIKKGEEKNRPTRYTLTAKQADIKVIDFDNKDWTIEVTASNYVDVDFCGSKVVPENLLNQKYKQVYVLEIPAFRLNLENGDYWSTGDQPDPLPQPIMFPKPVSRDRLNKIGISGNAYDLHWCVENADNKLQLKFVYYSSSFTKNKIEFKSLNIQTLSEMDQILSTFKFF